MVSEVKKELREISQTQKREIKTHHASNQNKINTQSKNIISLAAMSDTVKLQFTDRENTSLHLLANISLI